jgi:hypothetical protein
LQPHQISPHRNLTIMNFINQSHWSCLLHVCSHLKMHTFNGPRRPHHFHCVFLCIFYTSESLNSAWTETRNSICGFCERITVVNILLNMINSMPNEVWCNPFQGKQIVRNPFPLPWPCCIPLQMLEDGSSICFPYTLHAGTIRK